MNSGGPVPLQQCSDTNIRDRVELNPANPEVESDRSGSGGNEGDRMGPKEPIETDMRSDSRREIPISQKQDDCRVHTNNRDRAELNPANPEVESDGSGSGGNEGDRIAHKEPIETDMRSDSRREIPISRKQDDCAEMENAQAQSDDLPDPGMARLQQIVCSRLGQVDVDQFKSAFKDEVDIYRLPLERHPETGVAISIIPDTLISAIRTWFVRSLNCEDPVLRKAALDLREAMRDEDYNNFDVTDPGPCINLFYVDFVRLVNEQNVSMPQVPRKEYFAFLEAFMALETSSPLVPWLVYNRKRTIEAERKRISIESMIKNPSFTAGKGYIQLSEVLHIRERNRVPILPPYTENETIPTTVRALIDFGRFMEDQCDWPIQQRKHLSWLRKDDDEHKASGQSHSSIKILTREAGKIRCQFEDSE